MTRHAMLVTPQRIGLGDLNDKVRKGAPEPDDPYVERYLEFLESELEAFAGDDFFGHRGGDADFMHVLNLQAAIDKCRRHDGTAEKSGAAKTLVVATGEAVHSGKPDAGVNARLVAKPADASQTQGAPADQENAADDVAPSVPQVQEADDRRSDIEGASGFRVLGFNHRLYFLFVTAKSQVLEYARSDFTDIGLLELAPLNFWEEHFPSLSAAINKRAAANWIIRLAHERGIFDLELIRGRGAWRDDGRIVFHQGGFLYVDGLRVELAEIRSKYLYEAGPALLHMEETELTDDEGQSILRLLRTWNWETPADAALAAGWIALALICGALKWRPHVWTTGGTGTGKTTLVNMVSSLLGGVGLHAVASSTEAGIRQQLGCDARPVTFDEAEGGDDRADSRVMNVISLMRQASSDTSAHIYKGTQGGRAIRYSCRAMFLMSAIRAPLFEQADINRISVLSLRPLKNISEQDEDTIRQIDAVIADEHIGALLFRRSLNNLPTTIRNIATFTRVAARMLAMRRDADQLGTLVAGAWGLTSKRMASDEEAAEFLGSFNWGVSRSEPASSEGETVLQTISRQRVRDAMNREVVVAELIAAAVGKGLLDRTAEEADHLLQSHGLRVMEIDARWKLLVAKPHDAVRALARGSTYDSDPWRQMERIKGVRAPKQGEKRAKQRFARNPCSYIEIPVECVLGEDWESALVTTDPTLVEGEELFINRHPRASPKLQ